MLDDILLFCRKSPPERKPTWCNSHDIYQIAAVRSSYFCLPRTQNTRFHKMNRFLPEINIQTPQPSAAQGPRPSRTSKQILPYTKHYDPKWTLETGPGWSTAPTLNRTGTVIRGDDPSRLPAKYQAEQQEEHSRRTSSNTTASSN